MKILHRYIFKESLIYFSISLLAFTGVLLTLRILKLTELVFNKGVEARQIALVFLAIIPTFLEIALPLATLLGVMLAFARLSGDSEIIVIRASGISLKQLIRPVLFLGALIGVTSLYVSTQLRPWGYNLLSRVLFEIAQTQSSAGLDQGVFNHLGTMILYADKIEHKNGSLERVLIDDKRDPANRRVILAQKGQIVGDPQEQTITLNLTDGIIHEIIDNKYVVTKFQTNNVSVNPNEVDEEGGLKKERKNVERSNAELREELNHYREILPTLTNNSAPPAPELPAPPTRDEVKRKIRRAEIELGRRFSMPFASFMLALLALSLGVQPPRAQKTWGAVISISLGMLVFVTYYALLSIGIALGESGKCDPQLGLWLPNIVLTAVAIFTLKKICSEEWSSIAQGFENVVVALQRRFIPSLNDEAVSQ